MNILKISNYKTLDQILHSNQSSFTIISPDCWAYKIVKKIYIPENQPETAA